MLTQCPSCLTTFRITSEILRVADGQVRCGRCQTQFDARQRLIEETDAGEVHTGRFLRPSSAPPPAAAPAGIDDPAPGEDITLEGDHIEISGRYRAADAGGGEPQMREEIIDEWAEIEDLDTTEVAARDDIDTQDGQADADSSGKTGQLDPVDAIEQIVAIDDEEPDAGRPPEALRLSEPDLDQDVDSLIIEPAIESRIDLPVDGPALESEAIDRQREQQLNVGAFDEREPELQHVSALAPQESTRALDVEAAEPGAEEDLDLLPPRVRQPAPLIWKLLAVPLVLLLGAQLIHHHRATLALHPRIGPTLLSAYDALGLSIRPDWNLHAYEILQWHVAADPAAPGTLKVRASIKNGAQYAQPYPLLRLVLEDRWGEQVRAREFTPAQYLDGATAARPLLEPAQLANATVSIVDPGPDAEGFRFDVCLNGAHGPVCAADVPER